MCESLKQFFALLYEQFSIKYKRDENSLKNNTRHLQASKQELTNDDVKYKEKNEYKNFLMSFLVPLIIILSSVWACMALLVYWLELELCDLFFLFSST